MEPATVPQHLELDDVIAFGLGALDLVCAGGGALVGWWVALALSDDLVARLLIAAPLALAGLILGLARVAGLPCRRWLLLALAYAIRPRRLLVDAGR